MKKILVCNQKMYLTYDEARELSNDMQNIDFDGIELILCPSFLNFDVFSNYKLAAQDAFYEDRGAFTAEVSAYDLSLRGIHYALIGHSERRKYDTLETINLKIKALLKNSMTPILCVGEDKTEKELMRTCSVLRKQLLTALNDVTLESSQEILIAYEPRYLIGGKNSLDKNNIIDTFNYIRKVMEELGITNYKLLYGAAINSENILKINTDEIDGFLLGSSSVDVLELKNIAKCIK